MQMEIHHLISNINKPADASDYISSPVHIPFHPPSFILHPPPSILPLPLLAQVADIPFIQKMQHRPLSSSYYSSASQTDEEYASDMDYDPEHCSSSASSLSSLSDSPIHSIRVNRTIAITVEVSPRSSVSADLAQQIRTFCYYSPQRGNELGEVGERVEEEGHVRGWARGFGEEQDHGSTAAVAAVAQQQPPVYNTEAYTPTPRIPTNQQHHQNPRHQSSERYGDFEPCLRLSLPPSPQPHEGHGVVGVAANGHKRSHSTYLSDSAKATRISEC